MNHSKHRRIIWPVSLNGWAFVNLGGSSPVAVTLLSDIAPVSSKEFRDIQETTEYRFRKLGIISWVDDSGKSLIMSIYSSDHLKGGL